MELAFGLLGQAGPTTTQTVIGVLYTSAFFVVPFLIAYAIGKALNIRDYVPKMALVLFSIAIACAPFLNQVVLKGGSPLDAISFAIDLAGGTNLVYQVQKDPADKSAEGNVDSALMDRLVAAISRRINPAGTKEVVVRRVGADRVEVIIPGANPAAVEDTKRQMTKLGNLEFHIIANPQDHERLIARAKASAANRVVVDGKVIGMWRPIAKGREAQFVSSSSAVTRLQKGSKDVYEVLLDVEPDTAKQVTGKYLRRSFVTSDETGSIAVGFQFNGIGEQLFGRLTGRNLPTRDGRQKQLAIVLNNEVQQAPGIREQIFGNGIINGMKPDEVEATVTLLNSGALPCEISESPVSEFSISPTLGSDVKSKGFLALWVSALAVVIFMGAYYRLAGLIANFAMLLNLLFIVASMSAVSAAFSLPGLAGLVLSAGMAVDANVLIYERIREETARGASLRMAINNGFDKAFTAIFDSNITTLITAIILYVIGSEQVKGFAISLFIGLVMNLYTAVFISRLILEVLERGRVINKLNMSQWIGVTNIDFVGKQFIATTASVILVAVGLVVFFARGSRSYDIDFTGGSMVSMQFTEKQNVDDVRKKLETSFKTGNLTLEELSIAGQTGEDGRRFRLRTPNEGDTTRSDAEVLKTISDTFPNSLTRVTLPTFEVTPISKSAPVAGKTADEQMSFDDPYAGGTQAALTFSGEVGPATIERYIGDAFKELNHAAVEGLFVVEGTSGSGLDAKSGQVQLFDKILVKVLPIVPQADVEKAIQSVQSTLANSPIFDEVTTFASSVASETKQQAVLAVVFSIIAILIYVWFRFENWSFGLAAVTALVHDVLVSLAMVAICSSLATTPLAGPLMLMDFKINMSMIAAFLTIVGYSLNDTIVIFDRLREVRGKSPEITREMINSTVNQTLSRTLLTAFTVLVSVLLLYILGGEGIHGFAFCMVIGSIAGTYSTVYIASPLVLYFARKEAAKAKSPGGSAASAGRVPNAVG